MRKAERKHKMTFENLQKLENGTLLKIKGKGYLGNFERIAYFDVTCLKEGKGYLFGSCMYPFEWIRLATQQDLDDALQLAEVNYLHSVYRLKEAFEKTKKAKAKTRRK